MASKKRRILVTGVARWWGALVVQRLVEDPDVAEVIGIDIREPRYDLGRADYLKLDIRHSLIGKLVRAVGIDTVVHTLTRVDSFDMDPRRAHEMNVIGTLNLLAGCAGEGSPVRRFVIKSSGHVYGSRFDLPAALREDHRLDTNSRHQFVRDIVEVESYVSDFALRNPEIAIVVLRFSNSLNPQEPQPLARYLDLEVVPTVAGYDPSLQLIHRDDCIEAMYLATKRGPAGAYNIAAPGTVPLSKLLDAAGKLHAPLLPPIGLGLAAHAISGGQPDPRIRFCGQHGLENALVAPRRLRKSRLDKPRCYRVNTHFAPQPASKLAREQDPARLGPVVDAKAEARPQTADTGD